jgi:hypothetical protein
LLPAAVAAILAVTLAGGCGGSARPVAPAPARPISPAPDPHRPHTAASPLVVDQHSIGGKCSDTRAASRVSVSRPWCSIAAAVAAAPSSSTVLVRAGNYPYLQLNSAGSRTSYVTLEPYGYGSSAAERVTIEGLRLLNTSHLRFQGFHIVGSDADAAKYVPAVTLGPDARDLQLLDNDITDQGIDIESNPDDVLIQGDDIHDLTLDCAVNTQLDGSGIVGGGDHVAVIGNVIADARDAAMSFGSASHLLVSKNTVSSAFQSAGSCGHHVDLIELDNHAMGPVTITGNVFMSGSQFILRNATGLSFENNRLLDVDGWTELTADPGARIISNTWWGGNRINTGAGSLILGGYAPGSSWTKRPFYYFNTMAGTVVENNIMRLFGVDKYVSSSQYSERYNLIYGPRRDNSGLRDPGAHDLFATPVFVDPAAGNFHLASQSPGVGVGDPAAVPAADRLDHDRAHGPDIGALQHARAGRGRP